MIVVWVQNLVGKMISVVVNKTCHKMELAVRKAASFNSSLPAVGNSFSKPEQTA